MPSGSLKIIPNTELEVVEKDKASTDINGEKSVAEGINKLYKEHFDESLEVKKKPRTRAKKSFTALMGVALMAVGALFCTFLPGGIFVLGGPIGAVGAVIAVVSSKEAMYPEYSAKNSACAKLAEKLGIKGITKYTIPFTKEHNKKQQLIKIMEAKEKITEDNCRSFGVDKDFFNEVKVGLKRIQEEERNKAIKVIAAPSTNPTVSTNQSENKPGQTLPPKSNKGNPSPSITPTGAKNLLSGKEITEPNPAKGR